MSHAGEPTDGTAASDAPEPRPPVDAIGGVERRLEYVATRRVFDTSRALQAARSPDSSREHQDGVAFTCACCGSGGRTKSRTPMRSDAPCGCEQVWMGCRDDDCEQVSWTFMDYTDCDHHGRTRANDLWASLRPREGVYGRD